MKIDLSGKTAVVTGSTAGVGFRIAKGLALAGADIVLNGRKVHAVENAVEKLSLAAPNVRVAGVAADVGTAKGGEELVARYPRADIFVNNVGIHDSRDFFDISDNEWLRAFEINVMSGIRLARAYIPGMMERYWGRVMFISSEWALNIPADMIPYGLTKSAVLSVTQGLAKRLSCTGITVNAILPGPIQPSPEAANAKNGTELCLTMEETVAAYELKHHLSTLAFPRAATADEVANAVLFLSSSHAAAQTGTFVHVNGNVFENYLTTDGVPQVLPGRQ